MKLYADAPVRRAWQVTGDLLLLLWVATALALARVVQDATLGLASSGRDVEAAAGGLATRLRDAGAAVGDVPLVGDDVRSTFDGAGRSADQIAAAAAAQVDAVRHLAFWLAFAVASVAIALAVAVYLPRRVRFVRRATAGHRLAGSAGSLDLFALRALATQPAHRLARVSDDPVGAWRAGDPSVVRALAALELEDAGVSLR